MGAFIGKPYYRLDRKTNKLVLVTPEPIEFITKRQVGAPTGSRHGRMNLVLVEKLSAKGRKWTSHTE